MDIVDEFWKGDNKASHIGWQCCWYLELLIKKDGKAQCFLRSSKILSSTFISEIEVEPWMKNGCTLYNFYCVGKVTDPDIRVKYKLPLDFKCLQYPEGFWPFEKMTKEKGFVKEYLAYKKDIYNGNMQSTKGGGTNEKDTYNV
jgi:hypothetical protein